MCCFICRAATRIEHALYRSAVCGTVIAELKKQGVLDHTLVIFTNDNGPVLEEMSTPWRGTKNTTFEGGVRALCVALLGASEMLFY